MASTQVLLVSQVAAFSIGVMMSLRQVILPVIGDFLINLTLAHLLPLTFFFWGAMKGNRRMPVVLASVYALLCSSAAGDYPGSSHTSGVVPLAYGLVPVAVVMAVVVFAFFGDQVTGSCLVLLASQALVIVAPVIVPSYAYRTTRVITNAVAFAVAYVLNGRDTVRPTYDAVFMGGIAGALVWSLVQVV